MPERLLLHFDIADRQQELRDTAQADDFLLARRDTTLPFPAGALAYCTDFAAERVLFTLHGADIQALFDAPFLYAAQLRDAAGVVTVPFERVHEIDAETPCRPTLVFSPGRAGSTLLTRLFLACRVPCASEPDMLAQICQYGREERRRIGPDMEVSLLRGCLAALCRVLGPSPFVKLRSHCNARPLPLMEAAGHHPAILLMRRMQPWARSRHLAFAESPVSIAAILRETIDAADKLFGLAAPPRVLWFENLRANPLAVLRACVPDTKLDPLAIAHVMAADSQAGTALGRDAIATSVADADFDTAFAEAWSHALEGAEWAETTHALVERM